MTQNETDLCKFSSFHTLQFWSNIYRPLVFSRYFRSFYLLMKQSRKMLKNSFDLSTVCDYFHHSICPLTCEHWPRLIGVAQGILTAVTVHLLGSCEVNLASQVRQNFSGFHHFLKLYYKKLSQIHRDWTKRRSWSLNVWLVKQKVFPFSTRLTS